MKGTIRYDSDHAVFEVTESTSDLAEAGATWAFPEKQEAFEIEASVKRTHTHTKSAYMQPKYACKI